MAKRGDFTIWYSQGALSLTSAVFQNSNIVPFQNPIGTTTVDRFRISWINAGAYNDTGQVQGPNLPMHVGNVGHSYDASQGITFRYGDSYIFSVDVYSTNLGWFGATKWRRLKHTVFHTFVQEQVAPSDDEDETTTESLADSAKWLEPVLHQMMN